MPTEPSRRTPRDEPSDADRQTATLAGLAIALLLVVIGLFLVQELRTKARVEDCLLAGRRDCDTALAVRR